MQVTKQQFLIIAPVIVISEFLGLISIMDSLKFVSVVALTCYGFFQYHRTKLDKALITVFVGICLSMLSCQVFRGQSVIYSSIALCNFWSIGLYYYYMRREFSSKALLSAFTLLGKIVIVVYLLEYVLLQFGVSLNDKYAGVENTEMARMRISCSAAIYFVYFRYLQTFLKTFDKKSIVWMVVVIIVALIMNFRSIIAGLALFSFVQMWMQHVQFKTILYSCLIAAALGGVMFTSDVMSAKMNEMMDRQNNQTLSNKKYIRVICFAYYTTQHPKNNIERFLGSGMPSNKSAYGKYMGKLAQEQRLFYQDWGMIGLSWILGIVTVFGIFWYVVIAARCKVKNPCVVVWLMFLAVISIMTFELPRGGNFMVQAIALAYVTKRDRIVRIEMRKRKMLRYKLKMMSRKQRIITDNNQD